MSYRMWLKLDALFIFIASYTLTTVIGSLLILSDVGSELLSFLYLGLDVDLIKNINIFEFLFFIILPVGLLPFFLYSNDILLHRIKKTVFMFSSRTRVGDDKTSVLVVTTALVGYQFYILIAHGLLSNFYLSFSPSATYEDLIFARLSMMRVLASSFYYEITYVMLPTLIWFCFYNAFCRNLRFWRWLLF